MTTASTVAGSCRAATARRSHPLLGATVFVATIVATGLAGAEAAQELLRQYKCYICHSDMEARTGPAYIDVAAKYRGNKDAVRVLVAAVRNGQHGSGPWHMPPHPEVSNADAVTMVRYILSRKP